MASSIGTLTPSVLTNATAMLLLCEQTIRPAPLLRPSVGDDIARREMRRLARDSFQALQDAGVP
jgi:hypothetical protein